ncbi:MAG: hypothetical protein ACE5H0_13725 [Bacteroidota bacterium]
MRTYDEYWLALQKKVFHACVDEKDGAGNVRFSAEDQCLIKRFLPKIVDAVCSVKSDRIDPYIEEIRRQVCTECEYLKSDGTCDLRARAECCLDRYLPLIIEAIEQAEQEKIGRIGGLPPGDGNRA